MRIQTSIDSYPVLNGNTCFAVGASSGREEEEVARSPKLLFSSVLYSITTTAKLVHKS